MNIEVFQGNNKDFEVTVRDTNNLIIDLTGGTLSFLVKTWRGVEAITKSSLTPTELEITNALAGEATIKIIPADTELLSSGMYICYLNFINSIGKVYTITQGEFQIIDLGTTMYIRNRIRNYTGDKEELNVLVRQQETTDAELNDYIHKAVERFNAIGFSTNYSVADYPNLGNLINGTILEILKGKGILSARNTLSYSDAGGVNIQDYDTYGRYTNLYNVLTSTYMGEAIDIKRHLNVEGVYGEIDSPFYEGYEW